MIFSFHTPSSCTFKFSSCPVLLTVLHPKNYNHGKIFNLNILDFKKWNNNVREGINKKKGPFCSLLLQMGGGGRRKCQKTTKLFYKPCFCWCVPVCSWTPKTCFTLGLECLCHIYSRIGQLQK